MEYSLSQCNVLENVFLVSLMKNPHNNKFSKRVNNSCDDRSFKSNLSINAIQTLTNAI